MNNCLVIGSGPAGISAALYLIRAGIETTVITKSSGALENAELIENYYGFSTPISGKALHENGIAQAKRLGVKFVYDEVFKIEFGENFMVTAGKNTYEAKGIVIATGSARRVPNIENLKALDGKGVSYCALCDAFFYRGKDIAVLGDGMYASHEAQALLPIVKSTKILTNGKPYQGEILENVEIITNKITALSGAERLNGILFEDRPMLQTDGLFIALGTADSTALARTLGIQTENNKIVTDENFATNIPYIYAVGDCTGGLLQVSKSVYEGAKAGTELSKLLRKIK